MAARTDDTLIRPFAAPDRAAVFDVCVRTADAGRGRLGELVDDDLPADVFVAPYIAFDPGLALVLERQGRVVGYLVGTADTRAFADWYDGHWRPRIAEKYPSVAPGSPSARYVTAGMSTDRLRLDELVPFPAHLHMNLLPEAQGRGSGRALLGRFRDLLAERAVEGVHAATSAGNASARQFYEHLGFRPLGAEGDLRFLLAGTTAMLAPRPPSEVGPGAAPAGRAVSS